MMVSRYPSAALFDAHLAGWRSRSLHVMNHAGVMTEVLWFNFRPDGLPWARRAGANFTDRQHIKRRAENWGRRYEVLAAENITLAAEKAALEEVKLRQAAEIALPRERIEALEYRLGLNCGNNGRPQPSDGPGKTPGVRGAFTDSLAGRAAGGKATRAQPYAGWRCRTMSRFIPLRDARIRL